MVRYVLEFRTQYAGNCISWNKDNHDIRLLLHRNWSSCISTFKIHVSKSERKEPLPDAWIICLQDFSGTEGMPMQSHAQFLHVKGAGRQNILSIKENSIRKKLNWNKITTPDTRTKAPDGYVMVIIIINFRRLH